MSNQLGKGRRIPSQSAQLTGCFAVVPQEPAHFQERVRPAAEPACPGHSGAFQHLRKEEGQTRGSESQAQCTSHMPPNIRRRSAWPPPKHRPRISPHGISLTTALVVAAMLWGADLSRGQVKSGVFGSLHDVDGHGCKSCHVPHNGSIAVPPGADQSTGELLLWDRALSNVTFGTYDSPSMDRKPIEVGGLPVLRTEPRMYSLLCLSCHDAVTTPAVIMAPSARVGSPADSDGLRNDHPVNVYWNHQTLAGGLPPCSNCHIFHGSGQPALPFYGRYLQCATCHDPHTRVNEKFLRITNRDSSICRFCHG